jgi:acyl-CoA synthetase (AMP-forming)/AMP-acid ligase II
MPGETIVLNIHDPISHCCAIIASMSLGIANLSAIGMRLQLPRNLPISAILTDQEPQKIEAPEDGNVRIIGVSATWLKEGLGIRETPRIREDNDRVARIICTSGTTGEQKAVPFSEGQLIQRAWGQVVGLRPLAGQSKTLAMMGLSSGAGFTNMMLVLMTGGTLVLVPSVQQLSRFSSLYRMDRIIASTAQLIALVRHQENESIDFSGLQSMVVGGSHIPREVAKRARAICRNIVCLYGSTEMGVVATAPSEVTIKHPASVGYVVPGVKLEIVDEGGAPQGFGKEGIIRIMVPGAPNRYLNDEKATNNVFREGWFYPGDIGSLSNDGLLFVSGRVSERINAGGVKVAPNVIEDMISSRPEVADVAAFEYVNNQGISEIAVAIVPHHTIDLDNFSRPELRQYFQKQLREKTPRRWIIVKEIPRNEQGKIDRKELQAIARKRLSGRQVATG